MAGKRTALTAARLAGAAVARSPLGAKLAIAAGLALTTAVAALLVFMALFGVLLGGPARGQTVRCGSSAQGKAEIPARLVPIYQHASARYRLGERGPSVLAAINKIETGFGANQGPSSAGAVGWMQFMPSTWAAYGVDADGDGRRDPASPADAIHAAARYLRASGAPAGWYQAVFSYNHADWYVREVLGQAERFQGTCTAAVGDGGPVPIGDIDFSATGGPWAGTQRVARSLAALGRRHGCVPTSEKRPRKYTDSGGISDHWVGSRTSYAVDLDSATCSMTYPGGDADRVAREIAAALGSATHTGTVNVVRGAFRFQLIWQDDGHYDHVHIGVRRL